MRVTIRLASLGALAWLLPFTPLALMLLVAYLHGHAILEWGGEQIEHWLNERDRRRLSKDWHASCRWIRP